MDLVDQHQVHDVRAAVAQTALVTSVRFADRVVAARETGELHRDHPRRRRRGDRDVDDRQPAGVVRVAFAGGEFVGAAELD